MKGVSIVYRAKIALVAWVVVVAVCARGAAAEPEKPLYQDDPAIVKLLAGLGEHQSLRLPAARITGAGMETDEYWSKRTPGVRDYCNKMAYAPDRQTALYAGANHGAPSRLNDCWEYHLGSNTWIRLAVGDGGDHGRIYRARGAIRAMKRLQDAGESVDAKTQKAAEDAETFLKSWYADHAVLRDGYLQTKINGGPVEPWHTWDGLAYDAAARKLLWAVLDTDPIMAGKVADYAAYTGHQVEQLKAQLKPGTGLYLFDPSAGARGVPQPGSSGRAGDDGPANPAGQDRPGPGHTGRWARQLGGDPRPYLRGMGGSLTYIPDWQKTIWYCAAQNVSPNDFAMWTYDAVANVWADLKPNGGKSIRSLVHTDKVAPSSEVQMAYSSKHRALVAVLGPDTFVYDLDKNEWSKAVTDPRNQAHDAVTVFAYDSANDLFLLLNTPEGRYAKPREVRAFSLVTRTWETLPINGPDIDKLPYRGVAGYYDPAHNVFVVYDSGSQVWVYRVKPAASEAR